MKSFPKICTAKIAEREKDREQKRRKIKETVLIKYLLLFWNGKLIFPWQTTPLPLPLITPGIKAFHALASDFEPMI